MADYVMDTDGEYGKYIVQSLRISEEVQAKSEYMQIYKTWANRLIVMGDKVVPGAFAMNTSWYHSASDMRPLYAHEEHVHDFDEMIGFIGSNPDDPYDLGGVIEIGINGELHRLTKTSIIFMPGGVKHLPLSIIELHRPIFHFSISMSSTYGLTRIPEEESTKPSKD